jgi:hypothetical protein
MSFPSLSPPCSCFVEPMTFTQAARLLAGRSETTTFPTLVNWVDNERKKIAVLKDDENVNPYQAKWIPVDVGWDLYVRVVANLCVRVEPSATRLLFLESVHDGGDLFSRCKDLGRG